MGRPRKKRRQGHGSAWYWKQTDCWYYALPGSKKRIALFDDEGQRIRGKENQQAAMDGAREGKTLEEVMKTAAEVLTRADVMEGVAEMIPFVQLEAVFTDGSRLITVHDPVK